MRGELSPNLGPLVSDQSPDKGVREELSLLVFDHQLKGVRLLHILVIIILIINLKIIM